MTKTKQLKKFRLLPQLGILGGVLLILITAVMPSVLGRKAYAYNLITSRGIEMSSSAPGNLTAGQNASYTVSFTTATTSIIEGVVINFCDNDPIIGDTCSYTTGHSINVVSGPGAALTTVTGTQDNTAGHWTLTSSDGTASDGGMLTVTDTSAPESTTAINSGSTVSFTFTGLTNPQYATCSNPTGSPYPTPNCAFYARMLTYSAPSTSGGIGSGGNGDLTAAGGYSVSSLTTDSYENNLVDAGGAALSTAAQINITSKVQEELSFCVYTNPVASTDTCTTGNPPAVLLGNADDVLSTQTPFVDKTTQFDIQTNASVGAQVMMQGKTLTTSGAVTIAPMTTVPNPATANDLPVPGTSQFGLCDYGLAGFSGNLSWPTSGFGNEAQNYTGSDTDGSIAGGPYSCSDVTQNAGTNTNATTATDDVDYYFATGIGSTYGDTIAVDAAGPTNTGIIAFMADIAITQQAGIYTTTLGLIADATY